MLDISVYNANFLWVVVNLNWNKKLTKKRRFLEELRRSLGYLPRGEAGHNVAIRIQKENIQSISISSNDLSTATSRNVNVYARSM